MTVDIATLGIRIDSTSAQSATRDMERFRQAGAGAEQQTSALATVTRNLAAAMATLKIIEKAKEAAMLAARFETMGVVMGVAGNNAGYTRAKMAELDLQLQKTGISALKSREVLTSLATANIDLADATKLARASQDLAVVGNINSSEALARLTHGIQSGEVEILRGIGLNVNFENTYKKLASQLHTTTDKLTDHQKMQARVNVALQESAKFAGIYEEAMGTAGKQITSLSRYVEDAKVKVGGVFTEALTFGVKTWTDALKDANAELDRMGANGGIGDAGHMLSVGFQEAFKAVTVFGANVSFVLTTLGREVGGFAAILGQVFVAPLRAVNSLGAALDAAMKGNFSASAAKASQALTDLKNGASNVVMIWNDLDAQGEASRAALNKFEASVVGASTAVKVQTEADKAAAAAKEQARIAAGKAAREAQDAEDKRLKAAEEATKAGKKEADAYQGLITSIREATAENRLALALGEDVSASQKAAIKLDQELASGKLKLSVAHQAVVRAALGELAATEQLLKAQQAEKDVLNWIIQSTQARLASRDALAVEYEMYGKSSDARDIAMVKVKNEAEMEKFLITQRAAGKPVTDEMIGQLRVETAERTRVEQATMAQSKALAYATQLQDENKRFAAESIINEKARAAALLAIDADMWQQRIVLAGDGTQAQQLLQEQYAVWYANQVAKPQIEEQRKFWDSIDKTAHDTFVSIMDGGKGAAQRLKDTFKNVFYDWLYQMTLKKWIVSLQGQFSTSGAGGVAGVAQAVGGAVNAVGAGASLVQTASSLYSAITGGMTIAGGMGTGFVGSVAGGLMGAGAGSGLTSSLGMAIGNGILDVVGPGVAGALSTGIGAIATALPWVGGALAVVGLAKAAFGMGPKEVTGTTLTGNLGPAGFDGKLVDAWTQKGGWFRSDKQGTTDRAVDAAMATGLGDTYAKLTAASRDYAKALGVDADYITGRSQSLNIALTKDAAANEKAITDFFAGVADTVAGELVPGIAQFTKEGEAASATLQRLAVQYTAVDAILKAMGATGESAFGVVGVASLAARERLLTLTGGIDALASQTAFFAQNFMTEAERLKPVQDQVAAKMAELGFAGVTTADAFRNAVVGLQTSGALANEVGATAYAELLKIAPSFKLVADANAAAAQAQAEAAQKAVEKAAEAAQKLADINKPYQDRIAELEVELGYASAARATELVAMDASTRGLYEHEQGLLAEKAARDKRNAEYDAYVAKAAQDEQARQAQALAIAQQRAAMEIQLYNLTHTAAEQTAAARERELASIDPVLKGLQQQIYAQQELADAAAIAAKAIEDAAARAKAIASERAGIERSILQLQGNTAELRKLELAALDPANRALQESYFALQDKMAAEQVAAAQAQAMAQAQAQAAEEARRAEEALKAARQSATDSIFDEVKRIRGLVDGGGAMSLAGAQSAFAIATAQARAGDLDAMKALPGLSKSLVDLAQQNATSLQELRWIQATTAASLQQSAMGAASQYGLAIPKFDQGTNLITRGGLAVVHPGEAVVPAASNGPYRADSGGGDMRAVLAELQALRQEVASFHRDNSSENRDLRRVADTLERVTDGADAMRIKNGDDVLEVTGV